MLILLWAVVIGYGIFRASGTSEGGKTSHFLDVITNFLNEETEDIHRCVYFKAEGRLSQKVQDRYNVKFTTDPSNWDHGSVFVMECNIYETIAEFIETLVKNAKPNEKYIFLLDSLDGVIRLDDMGKGYDEA